MRFYLKTKKEKQIGDTKVVSRFLLFPKCIDNEIRWLERAKIVKKLGTKIGCDGHGKYWNWYDYGWVKD